MKSTYQTLACFSCNEHTSISIKRYKAACINPHLRAAQFYCAHCGKIGHLMTVQDLEEFIKKNKQQKEQYALIDAAKEAEKLNNEYT